MRYRVRIKSVKSMIPNASSTTSLRTTFIFSLDRITVMVVGVLEISPHDFLPDVAKLNKEMNCYFPSKYNI